MIDKARLLDDLRARVTEDLEALERRQREIQAGSTHEESRAEHAKDTRATEQSYLARGLAGRVEELRRTAAGLAALRPLGFGPDEPIAVSALARLSMGAEAEAGAGDTGASGRSGWWFVSSAGGYELEQDGVLVRTLTPVSPLGRALLGLRVDDEGTFPTPRGQVEFEVLEVA